MMTNVFFVLFFRFLRNKENNTFYFKNGILSRVMNNSVNKTTNTKIQYDLCKAKCIFMYCMGVIISLSLVLCLTLTVLSKFSR